MNNQVYSATPLQIPKAVYAVIMGLVSRLDVAIAGLKLVAQEGGGLSEWEVDTEAYLIELGVAGFFQARIVKMEKRGKTEAGVPLVYVTNQEESFKEFITLTDNLAELFDQIKEPTFYAYVRFWGDGTIQVVRQVETQPW